MRRVTKHILRDMPADFPQHVHDSNLNNMRRYGCGTRVLTRWRIALGIAPRSNDPLPMPDDFAALAPTMTWAELCDHYGYSDFVIRRWLREADVKTLARRGTRPPPLKHSGRATHTFNPQNRPARDTTRAGMAADYLRRFGPLFRSDAQGKALADGFFWNRGYRVVLTDEEVIERALRQGWQPDAWREVRAA